MTLYAFLNDTEGESTCTGDCLANWPAAVIGEHDTSVLDPALWSTVENPEAGAMLKIGDWPLYTFAADAAPGDVNGQGVGEVWYAVAPDGSLVEGDITVAEFAAPPADTAPGRHRAGDHRLNHRLNNNNPQPCRSRVPGGTKRPPAPSRQISGPSALAASASGGHR